MKMMMQSFLALGIALLATVPYAASQQTRICAEEYPDPHFTMWDGTEHFDYQKQCDIVFVKSPDVTMHFRTTLGAGYSFVSKVAFRSNLNPSQVIEVSEAGGVVKIDGMVLGTSLPPNYAGYLWSGTPQAITVDLGGDRSALFESYYMGALHVKVCGTFSGAEGMAGKWGVPGLLDRNGNTVPTGTMLGDSWSVTPAENLFQGPQQTCIPFNPAEQQNRCVRGRNGSVPGRALQQCADTCKECLTPQQVDAACQHIADGFKQKDCMYDVSMTGDLEWAKQGVYVKGDPHVLTWSGHKYDYHGECDLVMLQSPKFADGLGLDIHIRTKIAGAYSYISDAGVRIGDDVLEVGKQGVFVNGMKQEPSTTHLSGFLVEYTKGNKGRPVVLIDLGIHGVIIVRREYRGFVSVTIEGATESDYGESLGLMGEYGTGAMVARDGKTRLDEDPNQFGQEWQVRDTEPKLFQDAFRAPQYPEKCILPDLTVEVKKHRRLGDVSVTEADAQRACTGALSKDKAHCIFDVMATGDLEVAEMYSLF